MPTMPVPFSSFPQPLAQSCSLVLSAFPKSLPMASSRLLDALCKLSNFRHTPFFSAFLPLLQLSLHLGGCPNPSQVSSSSKASPLSELPQYLARGIL